MVDFGPTIVMQWLNFGILLFLLYKFLYNPLLNFLDERAIGIKNDMEEASKAKEEAEKTLDEYKAKISNIEIEAQEIFVDIRKKAMAEKQRVLKSAQEEANRIIEAAKREIDFEISKAKDELKNQVASLVVECSSKVLEREVRIEDHRKFVEDFISSY